MGARAKRAKRYRSGDCTLGWRGQWAVANLPVEGAGKRQRVRLGKFKRDSIEARDALDRFVETRRAIVKQSSAYTVGQLWDLWLAERKADGFRNDIYAAQWVSLRPVFANRLPHLLTTQDFRGYARARFDAGRKPWTVNTELVRLRACLKWAHETDLIDRRPKVWVPSPGKHRERVLNFDEARALLEAARRGDPHIYLFVVIAFATGARHSAILDLQWKRADLAEGLLEFDESLPPDPMSKAWRKGRATVPMNPSVRAALMEAYEGRQTDHVIEHGGRRLKTVREGFAAAVERAGLDQSAGSITPHTIRHSVLTRLDEAKVETRRAAQLAGHKNEETTRLVYTHSSPQVLAEAVGILDLPFAPLPKISHEPSVDRL